MTLPEVRNAATAGRVRVGLRFWGPLGLRGEAMADGPARATVRTAALRPAGLLPDFRSHPQTREYNLKAVVL